MPTPGPERPANRISLAAGAANATPGYARAVGHAAGSGMGVSAMKLRLAGFHSQRSPSGDTLGSSPPKMIIRFRPVSNAAPWLVRGPGHVAGSGEGVRSVQTPEPPFHSHTSWEYPPSPAPLKSHTRPAGS